ncbi:cytochrome P450 [Novosphingobium album (ex Hu et al. 2023)]|uniref:Cytochrome P450 n=1 Tax=Novosphingobium album (ex Hu et al. 2023) TaxID=2930093 RepID=A0ABT0B577_9SPHN|nr:cytochrome P450 [Novosphingobium album (ex Hu et al. 2023)]MCJ2180217.1 cytochrome P450 [Novosphingobium album (ex Hu et al. 2023)]
MASINDLDLEHLPIEGTEFGNDPMPFMDAARHKHEWLAASNIGYVVTGYREIDDILRLDAKLKMPGEDIVEIMGAEGTGWGDFVLDQMLTSSGERHARLRGSVSAAFGPGNVKRMRPIMRATVSRILDEWAPKGAFDFTDFAAQFPVQVMFALLGTSIDKLPAIIKSLEIHGESFNLEVENMGIIEEGYQTLWRFVDDLIAERGTGGENGDLLDVMITANSNGTVSDKELRQLLILMFAAGYDTTKNLLILLMNSLLSHPEIYDRCGKDFDYAKKTVREQLRFATPSNTMRIVTETFTYRDVVIPEGTMLVFPLTISGRDPAVFSEPMTFNPDRAERNPTQAFGRGMHICLGQFLAVANVEEGIHLIAQRIRNPRLAGERTWKPFPGVWGITQLPVEFDAEPAPADAVH